ncbi:MAG: ABC transporter ATP-binding protein [Candidatus Micrarchaeota archaeon]
MLFVKNVSKKIAESQILTAINLEVKEGELVAIFGPNGCGKTTLLNIIAGMDEDYSGKVEINSKTPLEAKSGFVFQNFHESLLPWFTVEENIALVVGSNDSHITEKWMEKVGVAHLKNSYPYQLSGGQKQLTAIARAYSTEPEILLFDEPFSALDYSITLKMQEQVQKLWIETKKTTIFVSHDPEEAIFLADRVIILSQKPGRIKQEIKINLPRPRNAKTRLSKKFFEYRNKVVKAFTK